MARMPNDERLALRTSMRRINRAWLCTWAMSLVAVSTFAAGCGSIANRAVPRASAYPVATPAEHQPSTGAPSSSAPSSARPASPTTPRTSKRAADARAGQRHLPIQVDHFDRVIRIACLGDEITQGHGLNDPNQHRYAAHLQAMLGPRFRISVHATPSATISRAGNVPIHKAPAMSAVREAKPDVIVIMLGTHDSKAINSPKSPATLESDLSKLIDGLTALPSLPRIWLCTPPPVLGQRYGIRDTELASTIAPAIRRVAIERHLPLVDLHADLPRTSAWYPDRVHLSRDGHIAIAKAVRRSLMAE